MDREVQTLLSLYMEEECNFYCGLCSEYVVLTGAPQGLEPLKKSLELFGLKAPHVAQDINSHGQKF